MSLSTSPNLYLPESASLLENQTKGGDLIMKIAILGILLVLYPKLSNALEVTLTWDAVTLPDVCTYTLYQADKYEWTTGAWLPVKSIPKDMVSVTVNVEDGKNFAWYVTVTDMSGNESQASNTVELYDKVAPHAPVNFTKE